MKNVHWSLVAIFGITLSMQAYANPPARALVASGMCELDVKFTNSTLSFVGLQGESEIERSQPFQVTVLVENHKHTIMYSGELSPKSYSIFIPELNMEVDLNGCEGIIVGPTPVKSLDRIRP